MSSAESAALHEIAAGEINGWRGRCLDLFAQAERRIDAALETAILGGSTLVMKHLSGHRLADLAKIAASEGRGTEKQSRALEAALEAWLGISRNRAFLAHGVATVLLDKRGSWHVQLDFTKYQSGRTEPQRWACSKEEALGFEQELERCFKNLSGQLGQFRKRLSA